MPFRNTKSKTRKINKVRDSIINRVLDKVEMSLQEYTRELEEQKVGYSYEDHTSSTSTISSAPPEEITIEDESPITIFPLEDGSYPISLEPLQSNTKPEEKPEQKDFTKLKRKLDI